MRETVKQWLVQNADLRGLLACGVRYPDEIFFLPSSPAGFPRENLENSLRCIGDTYQVLKLNHFPNEYIRWIYQNALVYCVRRADGIFLGLFTSREANAVDLEGLGRMLAEFPVLEPSSQPAEAPASDSGGA